MPIRWRLAGGSAALTLIILLSFALVIGTLLAQRLNADFRSETASAATTLQSELNVGLGDGGWQLSGVNIDDYAASQHAHIRVLSYTGDRIDDTPDAPDVGVTAPGSQEVLGELLETRLIRAQPAGYALLQYSRPLESVQSTIGRMWLLLALGVIGGAGLALLAGLALARQAMRPVADLTSVARDIATTGDSSIHIPIPESDDEIRQLAAMLASALAELDRARQATERALGRQKEFVADASHELRTPLTSLIGNLELLESDAPGQVREDAAASLRAARRMARIVADLLALAKADRPSLNLSSTALRELITEAVNDAGSSLKDRALQVEEDGSSVLADRDALIRALRNLLENAAVHTPNGTPVRISAHTANGATVFAVSDSGNGVPPEDREGIFDRFVRSGGDSAGSTGLGLAIVKTVALEHGGSVHVDESEEGGACFTLSIPSPEA